jgi:hypothetical protein
MNAECIAFGRSIAFEYPLRPRFQAKYDTRGLVSHVVGLGCRFAVSSSTVQICKMKDVRPDG